MSLFAKFEDKDVTYSIENSRAGDVVITQRFVDEDRDRRVALLVEPTALKGIIDGLMCAYRDYSREMCEWSPTSKARISATERAYERL